MRPFVMLTKWWILNVELFNPKSLTRKRGITSIAISNSDWNAPQAASKAAVFATITKSASFAIAVS